MRQARLVTVAASVALLLALAFAQSARAGVFEPLEVSKLSIALNFAKADKDRIALTALLPLGADFAAEGSAAVIDVGGVVRSFTLDAKGKSKVGDDRVAVTAVKKRGVVLGWKLTLSIAKANLAADLRDEGLTSVTVKKEPRNVTVTANVAGKIYIQTAVLKYTAKQGKTGSAKK